MQHVILFYKKIGGGKRGGKGKGLDKGMDGERGLRVLSQ